VSRAAEFPRLNTVIDEAATAAGRDPRSIRRIANLGELPGATNEAADLLLTLADGYGMDGFVFWPADNAAVEVERFSREIVPAVKAGL
jgi:hypothetical protein